MCGHATLRTVWLPAETGRLHAIVPDAAAIAAICAAIGCPIGGTVARA